MGGAGPDPAQAPPQEPLLDADDIQGDGLAGFRKDHQAFVFFTIADRDRFRAQLHALIPQLSTLREVASFNDLYRQLRRRRGRGHTGLVALWLNVAFTAAGLRKLAPAGSVEDLADASFKRGMAPRAGLLGDLPPPGQADATAGWRFGGRQTSIDGVLLIGCDELARLQAKLAELEAGWFGRDGGARMVFSEICHVRPDLPGHEHFGFRDGISQPGVRGRLRDAVDSFLTPRLIAAEDERSLRYARPGQPLIWPGEFVLGLPRQSVPPGDDLLPAPSAPVGPAWARNGSYVVIRRLRQDVGAFQSFAQNAALALQKAGLDMDSERLQAKLIGRWPSGAPLVRAPARDEAALGEDDFAANDFGFVTPWGEEGADGPVQLRAGVRLPPHVVVPDRYPAPQADDPGLICPHAAHVRKVNPRDQSTDVGGAKNTLRRRILRRGLPFGPPWSPAQAGEERGLMFVSYQASIESQFEFLMTDWVDKEDAPRDDPGGMDLVIGGKPLASRKLVIGRAGNAPPIILDVGALADSPWIAATGGEYLFAPSLSALREVLATPGA